MSDPGDELRLRDLDVADDSLLDRFRSALFESGCPGNLRPSIRIASGRTSDHIEAYRELVIGLAAGPTLWSGWWRGDSALAQVADMLGEPGKLLALARGTDLDLVLWWGDHDRIFEATRVAKTIPTLLATREPGWLLISPPGGDGWFLYPEVSASDG